MTRMTGPDCAVMCNSINTHTHTHTSGSRKAEQRQTSTRNRTRVVDAMWETGETWLGRKRKNVVKTALVR